MRILLVEDDPLLGDGIRAGLQPSPGGPSSGSGHPRGRRSMKLRTGHPWVPAAVYAQTLKGLASNLLVRDVEATRRFQQEVLGA